MGVILLAVPRPPEIPTVIAEAEKIWFGLKVEWLGWDGSRWTLTNPAGGVFVTPGGVEGFGPPEYTEWVQNSPAVAGQFFRGVIAKPRQLFFPTAIYTDNGSVAWGQLQSAFFRSVKAGRYGTVRVTTPAGQVRTIQARSNSKPPTFNLDPFKTGFQGYGFSLVADQPYWVGQPIVAPFKSGAPADFFNGASKAPAFLISEGASFSSANVTNPGDEDAWPVWTLVGGAATSTTLGVGGSTISVPFTVAAGKALQIDTDPRVQTALYGDWDGKALTGTITDRTVDLGTVDFAPVPPGVEVPLSVALTGTGSVQVSITPLYEMAW